jgi:hypothetical protein
MMRLAMGFLPSTYPKGTITWAPDELDRELTQKELQALPPLLYNNALTYCYRNHKGNFILPWDHTRYVNHSSFPNTRITPYGFEIAIHDIQAGDQILNDYGTLNIIEAFEPCHEPGGRKTVCPDDIARYHEDWDQQIHEALKHFFEVEQPLLKLLSKSTLNTVQQIVAGSQKPEPILKCLFQ